MKLILFTSSFPFGEGEQFLETEIKYLSKEFDNIIIIPTYAKKYIKCRATPPNTEVKNPIFDSNIKRILNLRFISHIFNFHCLKIIIRDFVRSVRKRQVRLFLTALNSSYYIANEPYVKFLIESTNRSDLLYFYWGAGAAFMLPFMADVQARKVFRVHGSDLYEFLNNDYFPFRSEQIDACDRVFPVSNNGLSYLIERYPLAKDKGKVFRLGVDVHPFLSEKNTGSRFHIVSCSSVIKLKRVSLIVDILKNIQSEAITWTHFGDGDQKHVILKKAESLSSNIKTIFRGFVPNKEIYEFYKNESVDLFVNVSSSEGVPVSIMESLSYGIPVVATDVGGTSELVNEHNGILICKDFEPAEVANKLMKIIKGGITFDRKVIKSRFKSEFDASKNYSEFSRYLKYLSECG
jgi:glycosyltransferase involved in cell wall biosynthesis